MDIRAYTSTKHLFLDTSDPVTIFFQTFTFVLIYDHAKIDPTGICLILLFFFHARIPQAIFAHYLSINRLILRVYSCLNRH